MQNFVNKKKVHNAPNTLSISRIIVTKISLQYMSCKTRHKKVQHYFLKKKNLKGQVEEKKELSIQGSC